jgi:translocation and assembly module TamA
MDHSHNQLPTHGWRAVSKLSLDRRQQLGTGWTGLPNDNGWRWFTSALAQRQPRATTTSTAWTPAGGRSKSTKNIDRTYFLRYDYANSQGLNAPADSAALSANYGWTGRYFNSTTAPTRGWGMAVELGAGMTCGPNATLCAHPGALAVVLPRRAGGGRQRRGPRRTHFALRAEVGAVLARDSAEIPVTQLFLTGGDTTVRGYGYRSIGARTKTTSSTVAATWAWPAWNGSAPSPTAAT